MSQLVQRITYTQTTRNVEMKLQIDAQVAYSTAGVLKQLYLHWKKKIMNTNHLRCSQLSMTYRALK